MTTTTISNVQEWIAAAQAGTHVRGQTIELVADLVFVTAPTTLDVNTAAFRGNDHTVTLAYDGATHNPLFSLHNGSIFCLRIVQDWSALPASGIAVVATAQSGGIFRNVAVSRSPLLLTQPTLLWPWNNYAYLDYDDNFDWNPVNGLISNIL